MSALDYYSFGRDFLEDICEWISSNVDIDDVYSDEVIISYINKDFEPEDVYPKNVLIDWATINGFVKEN